MTKEEAKQIISVLTAYCDDKPLQVHTTENGWEDILKDQEKEIDFLYRPESYRVKPEPKYRPYANAKEFLTALREHGPYYIQIDINAQQLYMCPNSVCNQGFWTYNDAICSYDEFMTMYEWQDGNPCGIMEE